MKPRPKAFPALLTLLALALAAPAAWGQAEGDATVTFATQSSGGASVVVESATLPQDGFVAIHDAAGAIVGVSSHLEAGTHHGTRVLLNRPLAAEGEPLSAMLHRDTDGNRIFDFLRSRGTEDVPYSHEAAAAHVLHTASIVTSPQKSTGASLLVERLELADGGFLVLRDTTFVSAQDVAGSVVGVSPYLAPGVYLNLAVVLDRPVSAGPLLAMPHRDVDGDRAFDRATSADPPFAGTTETFAGNFTLAITPLEMSRQSTVTFPATSTGGHLLVVPEAFLAAPGFVAVHDETLLTEEDARGSVVGVSQPLPAGLHRNVHVTLGNVPGHTRTLEKSGAAFAVLYEDTNANGVYDFVTSEGADDKPFAGPTSTFMGDIVVASADVTLGALVLAADQITDGRALTVRAVDLAQGGFVAARGLAGTVVGVSDFLAPGRHDNVTIPLSPRLDATQPLTLVPHQDRDGDRAFGRGAAGPEGDTVFAGVQPLRVQATLEHEATLPPPATPGTPPPTIVTHVDPPAPTAAEGAGETDTSGEVRQNEETPAFTAAVLAAAAVVAAVARRRRA